LKAYITERESFIRNTHERVTLPFKCFTLTHRLSYHDSKFLRALLYRLQTFRLCEIKYNGVPTDILAIARMIVTRNNETHTLLYTTLKPAVQLYMVDHGDN
jgi:hypothetical protein